MSPTGTPNLKHVSFCVINMLEENSANDFIQKDEPD